MTRTTKSIIKEGKNYTFSDYFELDYPTKDIIVESDYSYEPKRLDLLGKAFENTLGILD